jgi:peptidoglycan/LPS O-acetylase OafA/YrhL
LPYLPGVDGLRAIAVLAVIFYHANLSWAVGGFLGVESFFVISGFLITMLLLREYETTGRIALNDFWLRRARRLLPALWAVLIVAVPLVALWAPEAIGRFREDVPGALLYVTNWLYIFREVPYFEHFGRPPVLQHLWSLAVEEQFYIVWPLALWAMLRGLPVRRTSWLALPILLGGVMSSAWMATLYDPMGDPARVYYGTDTRAAGFLLGAALATGWRPERRLGRARWVVDLAGLSGLAGLVWLFTTLNEYASLLYRGGFVLTALFTGLVVMAASNPHTWLARGLGHPVLRWIGTRSYGLYLWHWPIMVITGRALNAPLTLALQLAATCALAELSYRWIEQPIRQHGFKAVRQFALNRLSLWQWRAVTLGSMVLIVSCSLMQPATHYAELALAISPTLTVPVARATQTVTVKSVGVAPHRTAAIAEVEWQATVPPVQPTWQPATATPQPTARPIEPTATVTAPTVEPAISEPPSEVAVPAPANLQYTFIGDSIMESVTAWIENAFAPGTYAIAAQRSRRMEDALALIHNLAARGRLAPTVIIHLGTNVPFEPATFDAVMQSLVERGVTRVYFLNVRRPVAWEYTVNVRIAEGVSRWPQATLIDWYQHSADQPGWFIADAVHPTYTGSAAYVTLILNAVQPAQ